MTSTRGTQHIILLICVSALVFFVRLGDAPLWDRDEPRNAGCAAEMMEAGDWVVPIFNAELRTHKPVLLYWLMMSSYSVFGVNEFGARFFSAFLGIATVLLTYGMGRRLFAAEVGKWSGLILSSTIMFGVASRAATPDALLIFCSTLAISLFVFFAFREGRAELDGMFPDSPWAAVSIYAAMGLGVLAKGPVGLVLPTAVIGMYLLIARLEPAAIATGSTAWRRRLLFFLRPIEPVHFLKTCWAMRPVTAILTVAAVAAPWYAWVAVRTNGAWTDEFFWTHNVSRATNTMEGHSGPPILFYVGAILVGFFPWSILTIPTGMHLFAKAKGETTKISQKREIRTMALLLCWVGVYIGIFSLARTKLPSYVTPCYPALAILAGVFVHDWRKSINFQSIWLKVGLGNFMVVGLMLLIALPIAANRFLPGSEWLGVVGVIPMFGGVLCWRFYAAANHSMATKTLAISAITFLVTLMAVVPAEIGQHRSYDQLFEMTAKNDGPIASFGHLEPSWIFYGGRPIRDFEVTELDEFDRFVAKNPNTLVITTPKRLKAQDKLSEEFELVHQTEYFLRDRRLVLVRPLAASPTEVVAERDDSPRRK